MEKSTYQRKLPNLKAEKYYLEWGGVFEFNILSINKLQLFAGPSLYLMNMLYPKEEFLPSVMRLSWSRKDRSHLAEVLTYKEVESGLLFESHLTQSSVSHMLPLTTSSSIYYLCSFDGNFKRFGACLSTKKNTKYLFKTKVLIGGKVICILLLPITSTGVMYKKVS